MSLNWCLAWFRGSFQASQKSWKESGAWCSLLWRGLVPPSERWQTGISSTGAKIAGSGGSSGVGANAEGDNNWRGGVTWVGEKGPELVNLPRGTRILPNKESVSLASGTRRSVVQASASGGAGTSAGLSSVITLLTRMDQNLAILTGSSRLQPPERRRMGNWIFRQHHGPDCKAGGCHYGPLG